MALGFAFGTYCRQAEDDLMKLGHLARWVTNRSWYRGIPVTSTTISDCFGIIPCNSINHTDTNHRQDICHTIWEAIRYTPIRCYCTLPFSPFMNNDDDDDDDDDHITTQEFGGTITPLSRKSWTWQIRSLAVVETVTPILRFRLGRPPRSVAGKLNFVMRGS